MPSESSVSDRERPIRATDVGIVVRPPADDDEVRAVFDMEGAVFLDSRTDRVEQWYGSVVREPGYQRDNIRAAWAGDRCVGAAIVHRRDVLVHGATVSTAQVSGVGVLGELRGHGVGSAVMQDVRRYCAERGDGLATLIGAHLFYDPFGYVDVLDLDRQFVLRSDVAAREAEPAWSVRPATADDAAAVLALYDAEYGGHTGHVVRSVAEQRLSLELSLEEAERIPASSHGAAPRVVLGPQGAIAGYATVPSGVHNWIGWEVVAPSWPAALALLREHVALPERHRDDEAPSVADAICWMSPSDSRTTQTLGDHLPVHTMVERRPSQGWMAMSPAPSVLLDALASVWTDVARRHERGVVLEVDGSTVSRPGRAGTANAVLPAPVFLPLLFGYRTLDWAAEQDGVRIDDAALPLLTELMNGSRSWVAPSDAR